MRISPDPCKGGLESLGHFHSLPEFNTEVHDGVAIGVNFWVCLWDSWCMILWSFSYDKAFEQLFSSLSLPLCVCFHFERLRQHLVQTIAIDHCKIFWGRDPEFYMHFHLHINIHIIHIQVDIIHIHVCIHNTNLLVHIIPDQFAL